MNVAIFSQHHFDIINWRRRLFQLRRQTDVNFLEIADWKECFLN